MLSIPVLSRAFSLLLVALGVYLAFENTIISAEVLASATGASTVAANAIAISATGLELVFASWIRQGESLEELWLNLKTNPKSAFLRLILAGSALALVYHFDMLTTALHPGFSTESRYFFSVVIAAFVFGPEACIVISAWVWQHAKETETKQMATTNHKDAENAFRQAERQKLVSMAKQAGADAAVKKATKRWGEV